MKPRLQFGGWLIALGISVGMVVPCAAQNRDANKPPQQPKQQQRQLPRQEQRQERRQQQPEGRRVQNGGPSNDRPRNQVAPNRFPANRPTGSMSTLGGNHPPNMRGDSAQPNFNPNRPPNASNSPANARRFQDLSPADRQRVLQNREKFDRLPPQRQQEIREAAQNWNRLTREQQSHIKNDVFPKWQQMPPDRQRAIRQRLGVLQNMPESARNQHLSDPNFTRGMSEEDKAMLRDLSHMHVGAPDPPNE
jgi:uncharacterized protein DUF3106